MILLVSLSLKISRGGENGHLVKSGAQLDASRHSRWGPALIWFSQKLSFLSTILLFPTNNLSFQSMHHLVKLIVLHLVPQVYHLVHLPVLHQDISSPICLQLFSLQSLSLCPLTYLQHCQENAPLDKNKKGPSQPPIHVLLNSPCSTLIGINNFFYLGLYAKGDMNGIGDWDEKT